MLFAVFVQKRGTLPVDLLTPSLPLHLLKGNEFLQWYLDPVIILFGVLSPAFGLSAVLFCFSVSGPCLVLSRCPGLWLGWGPGLGRWACFLLPGGRSGLAWSLGAALRRAVFPRERRGPVTPPACRLEALARWFTRRLHGSSDP